jgi:hypothetical protein
MRSAKFPTVRPHLVLVVAFAAFAAWLAIDAIQGAGGALPETDSHMLAGAVAAADGEPTPLAAVPCAMIDEPLAATNPTAAGNVSESSVACDRPNRQLRATLPCPMPGCRPVTFTLTLEPDAPNPPAR